MRFRALGHVANRPLQSALNELGAGNLHRLANTRDCRTLPESVQQALSPHLRRPRRLCFRRVGACNFHFPQGNVALYPLTNVRSLFVDIGLFSHHLLQIREVLRGFVNRAELRQKRLNLREDEQVLAIRIIKQFINRFICYEARAMSQYETTIR